MNEMVIFSTTLLSLKINIPIRNRMLLTDLIYFLTAECIKSKIRANVQIRLDDDFYDYVSELVLYEGEKQLIGLVCDEVIKKVTWLLNETHLNYLLDYDGEIYDVQYRYNPPEKYIKFFVKTKR